MSGWKVSPFVDVMADESGGNNKTPKSEFLPEGLFAVVDQGKELIAGYVNDERSLCRSELPVIVFGDHTRCIKFVDFPFCMGADGIKVLRPKGNNDVKYIYHYLRQLPLTDGGYDRHYKYLKRTEVVLPPLPEQRRIAEILDRADALRQQRRAALAALEALPQAIFLEMFGDPVGNPMGWPTSTLNEICNIAGEYGANVSSDEYNPQLPRYVRITDITSAGELTPNPVSPSGHEQKWRQYKLEEGDLLFARSGATVGKTYLHQKTDGSCVFAGYLIRFRPNASVVDSQYLFRFTQTSSYFGWVQNQQRAVAQPNINAQQYGHELPIPLPPLPLQQEFARRVEAVERVKATQRAHLAELDALFQSLQHRAFRGEL